MTGDCKSPAFRLRRFESYFQHQVINPCLAAGVNYLVPVALEPTKLLSETKVVEIVTRSEILEKFTFTRMIKRK